MVEFTGERLVPGQVDSDLWNEHISRYAFAVSFCTGRERVIDAGCGTGYGSHYLSRSVRSVLGVDYSADAIAYANCQYANSKVRFVVGLCEALPVRDQSADLILAFEVIEHLEGWKQFLAASRRALAPGGVFVLSTPNKRFYEESRGTVGPNPFHVHEFEFDEFERELRGSFAQVIIFGQNQGEAMIFSAAGLASSASSFGSLHAEPADAEFFVAVCAEHEMRSLENLVYVANPGNVLQERKNHIALVQSELESKNAEHLALLERHREQEAELRRSNEWAYSLNGELKEKSSRILALQNEIRMSNEWAASLDREVRERGDRIAALQAELARGQQQAQAEVNRLGAELDQRLQWARALDEDLVRAVDQLHKTESVVEERTKWAQALTDEVMLLRSRHESLMQTGWVKVGRRLHFLQPPQ